MLSIAFSCALLSVTVMAGSAAAGINWVQGNWSDALQQAYSTRKPIMAFFFRQTCEGCIIFAESTLAAPEVVAFADSFVCARFDMDSDAGHELGRDSLKVTSSPVTVFFDWKGEETDRVVGGPPAPQFLAEMKRIRSGRDTVRDLLARESQHRDGVEFNALLGGKLAQRGDQRGRPYLQRVLAQDSTNAKGKTDDAFLGLYRLARLDGDMPGAIALLERMLRSYPNSEQAPMGRSYLAFCYRKIGQNERADSLEAAAPDSAAHAGPATILPVTVTTARGPHVFRVELARTQGAQDRGLQGRKDIDKDGGMLFAPYPPQGGPPAEASFWMANTPIALDIIFIRADGTIARIAANAVPLSRTPIMSRTPVAAVLEILGGRAAELGIAEGNTVSWQP